MLTFHSCSATFRLILPRSTLYRNLPSQIDTAVHPTFDSSGPFYSYGSKMTDITLGDYKGMARISRNTFAFQIRLLLRLHYVCPKDDRKIANFRGYHRREHFGIKMILVTDFI